MSARVEGNDVEVPPQIEGHERPDPGAEPVRVMEKCEGTVAAKVEQRDLDPRLGSRDPAAPYVCQHGRTRVRENRARR